jgi:hypothetical protein
MIGTSLRSFPDLSDADLAFEYATSTPEAA